MLGYQAAGAAPLVNKKIVDNPETIATAIRIGNPQSLGLAKKASEDSEGWFESLSDDEIIKNQKLLAQYEGIFCEPTSAISVGLKICERKIKGSVVTCTLTGHGLKDPDIVIDRFNMNVEEVPADRKAVADIIGRYIMSTIERQPDIKLKSKRYGFGRDLIILSRFFPLLAGKKQFKFLSQL